LNLYQRNKKVISFDYLAEFICGLFGLVILIISIFQVIMRVGYSIALPWVFELTSLLTVYAVFFGASALILRRKTAQVTIFLDMVPDIFKIILNFLRTIALLILSYALIVGGWKYRSILSTYMMSNIPLSSELFSYPVIIFGIVLTYQGIITFIESINLLFTRTKKDKE